MDTNYAAFKPAYLRIKDAATFVGLSPSMLLKLVNMGQGPPRVIKGRCVLYGIEALRTWMENDRV